MTATPEKDLLYDTKDGIATITINRERQKNAISPEAVRLFQEALESARKDDGVKAVCITGAGDKVFCSEIGRAHV